MRDSLVDVASLGFRQEAERMGKAEIGDPEVVRSPAASRKERRLNLVWR